MTRRFLLFAALALAWMTAAAPRPAAAQQDAGTFIQEMGNQGISVMGPSVPYQQRYARFYQLFNAYFDVRRIAYFALGAYTRSTTPEQQQQFIQAFSQSIVAGYATKLGQYGGEPFRVTGVRQGAGEYIVSSQIERPTGPLMIEWHVVSDGGQLKITDVVIGGLSMLIQERDLFARLMQQSNNRFDIAIIALARS